MKILKITWYVLCIFVLIFCLIELSLRFSGELYLKRLYVHKYIEPKYLNSTNILCFGESSTAGLGVHPQDSYPAQLEAMLRKRYPNNDMRVIVPPHVGQNTSQVLNRIEKHIKFYRPKLIILMAGYNNEWSLAESNISKVLSGHKRDELMINSLIMLNNFRSFKFLRYAYLKYILKEKSQYIEGLENMNYVWGGPELVRLPQKQFVYSFADSHRDDFIKLWEHDVSNMISIAKKYGIDIILMTYHINPTYLSEKEFKSMAEQENILLVKNDKIFQRLIDNGTIREYLLQDNWHPNKKGYTLIAKNLFKTVASSNFFRFSKAPLKRISKYSAFLDVLSVQHEEKYIKVFFQTTNTGYAVWTKKGKDLIKAGCRMYEDNNYDIAISGFRFELPKDIIKPGETFTGEFLIDRKLLKNKGHRVKIDMVNEHKFWFEDIGVKPAVIDIVLEL